MAHILARRSSAACRCDFFAHPGPGLWPVEGSLPAAAQFLVDHAAIAKTVALAKARLAHTRGRRGLICQNGYECEDNRRD
jgi:hypothetical protein